MDKVVSRFESKLPLIFGKWKALRKYLKVWAAYNFDVVLDESVLKNAKGISLDLNGNKDYDSVASMISFNNSQRSKVFKSGCKCLYSFKQNNIEYLAEPNERKKHDDSTKVEIVHNFLWGAIFDTLPEYSHSLVLEDLQDVYPKYQNLYKEDELFPIQMLEEYFANEITLMYYINLNSESYRGINPNPGTIEMFVESQKVFGPQPSGQKNMEDSHVLQLSPKERFKTILKKDGEIREFISAVFTDVLGYQKAVSMELGSLSQDLGLVRKI